MKEYDIFAPLYYNDGEPVEAKQFQILHKLLLDQFGGLTFFPQPNKAALILFPVGWCVCAGDGVRESINRLPAPTAPYLVWLVGIHP